MIHCKRCKADPTVQMDAPEGTDGVYCRPCAEYVIRMWVVDLHEAGEGHEATITIRGI